MLSFSLFNIFNGHSDSPNLLFLLKIHISLRTTKSYAFMSLEGRGQIIVVLYSHLIHIPKTDIIYIKYIKQF